VQRTLGRGAFGTVYLTKQDGTGTYYAVKETFQNARYKNREAEIIKMLSHPVIIKVFQMFYTQKKDGTYLNIVMEYLPATLHDVIQQFKIQRKQMPESDIAYYMFQLSRSCAYLERRSICHRDIKPQNILVNPHTNDIRLCDFGSAKILSDGEWNKHYICSRFYRAPELLCESNYYTCSVDTWSLGCVMAEMYTGEPLFAGANTKEQLKLISGILGPVRPGYPDECLPETVSAVVWHDVLKDKYKTPSMPAADLLKEYLKYDFHSRAHLIGILFHSFLGHVGMGISAKGETGTSTASADDGAIVDEEKESADTIKWSATQTDREVAAADHTFRNYPKPDWLSEELEVLRKFQPASTRK
jgi:serine/threonine protein kinase